MNKNPHSGTDTAERDYCTGECSVAQCTAFQQLWNKDGLNKLSSVHRKHAEVFIRAECAMAPTVCGPAGCSAAGCTQWGQHRGAQSAAHNTLPAHSGDPYCSSAAASCRTKQQLMTYCMPKASICFSIKLTELF